MKRLLLAALVLTMGLAPPVARACNVRVVWQADLTGAEVSPPVTTAATGVAVFQFDLGDGAGPPKATVIIDLQKAKGVTSIDLRAGDSSKPGPVLFSLYTPKRGKLGSHYEVVIKEADLQTHEGSPVKTFADAANAVVEGAAFITVNTRANPTGELRGRIGMRKVPIYSPDESGTGHNAQLHQQAQAQQGRKARGKGAKAN